MAESEGRPRIPLVDPAQSNADARAFFEAVDGPGGRPAGSKLHVIRTLAHNPELGRRYFTFGAYILQESTLDPALRELVTLRTAALYDSDYEWIKHERKARGLGVFDEEIAAARSGEPVATWPPLTRALVDATAQIVQHSAIDDATWEIIAGELDYAAQLDFVFTVSSYAMLAMCLGALRVQLEPE